MDNCKYNYKYNCECNLDKYEDNCNKCNKCRKLEKISEELTRESAELNEVVEEKLEGVKYIQREIDELEERLECLRKKQKLNWLRPPFRHYACTGRKIRPTPAAPDRTAIKRLRQFSDFSC